MGKKIWITGTNRGLGCKLVSKFKDARHQVKAINRDRIDLSFPPEEVHAMFVSIFDEEEEAPDVFIHNAGVTEYASCEEADMYAIEKMMRVNHLSRAAINSVLMTSSRYRHPMRILHVGSIAGLTPMRDSSSYCASKAADEMYVKVLGRELATNYENWQVMGVNPGMIPLSDMAQQCRVHVAGGQQDPDDLDLDKSPMESLTNDDVYEVIKFLALHAPNQMNGEMVTIPGGVAV